MKKKLPIDKLLDKINWQEAWKTLSVRQARGEDDSQDGFLAVVFSCDGDGWIATHPSKDNLFGGLRFRMPMVGGGQSPRVRKALAVLSMAIKADNEDPNNLESCRR